MDDRAAPLLDAWRAALDARTTPFTIPGHKRRVGAIWPTLGELLAGDVPLFGGLDTIKDAAGTLGRAEAAAADLWGADWCRFGTGGSTEANQVAALALGAPGRPVLVTRSAHRSTISGLVLAGLDPVWLPVGTDDRYGLPTGADLERLGVALRDHPDAAGVICVEPSYAGTLSDLRRVVALAHAHDVPVVVDQAWAGHFGFAPGFPEHALQAGADAMIVSAHKALLGYSQSALVLARTERLDAARLDRAADALATTSPAGSILAGIDASRALLGSAVGVGLLGRLLDVVEQARDALRDQGFLVPGPDELNMDPAKLVIGVHDGLTVERELIARGLPVEHADRDTVIPMVTIADDDATVGPLVTAILEAARPAERATTAWRAPEPTTRLSPRAAFFAEHETVSRQRALGRVSAETIAPYPPGIPVLAPGEVITDDVLDVLADAQARGARIAYAADPTLASFGVVRADHVGYAGRRPGTCG